MKSGDLNEKRRQWRSDRSEDDVEAGVRDHSERRRASEDSRFHSSETVDRENCTSSLLIKMKQ